ncbi:MAG TPA: PEPxxWA-CTERM sorting domain-containing protein [Rhodocyclaceae bacterium]|nr:PEPxxWA-CTERM sorting domain-containing protein [Rhodocyclaceae bacterium]
MKQSRSRSRFATSAAARAAAIGLMCAWPGIAAALTWVEAGARNALTEESLLGDTRAMPDLAGEAAVHGRVGLNILALTPWDFGTGPLPPACPALNCTSPLTIAYGQASADADAGVLKAGAYAAFNGTAGASAGIEDTLSIGNAGGSLHMDLRVDGWRAKDEGDASYRFLFGRRTGDTDFPFEKWVQLEVSGSGDWDLLVGEEHRSGSLFGGRVELDWVFAGLPTPGARYSMDVFASLEVRADCALASNTDGRACGAEMDAVHSSYMALGGDVASLSGYAWRGVAPPVPEPETWAMLLSGLGLLGAAARKRRTPV